MIKIKSTVFFTLFVNFILSSHLFASDLDIDAVLDDVDNCISISNFDQANFDGDRFGDACDIDDDNDGLIDRFDPYPFDASQPENADKRLVVTNSRTILSGKNELAAVGTTLDVDDNWVAVGSAAEDPRGVVYLLENQGQGVHHVVQKMDGNQDSRTFGRSVDLNMAANLLTVSDSNSNTGGTQAGQVLNYSFVDGQWSLFGESIPGGSTYSFLSNSKSNEQGDFLVVRSAAHVLRTYTLSNESWVEVGSRLGGDLSDDLFAHDYELSGDGATLFVGASRTDGLNVVSDVGAFYKYERIEDEWVLADQVDGLVEGGRFGEQLALSDTGRYLAVTEQGRGYIYVYDLLAADWKATPLVIQQPFYTWEFGWSIEFSEDDKILFVGTYSGEHFIYYDDGISWRLLADTSHDFRMPSRGYGRIVGVDKDGSNYYVASPESSVSYLRGGSLETFSIDYDSDLDGIADADDTLPLVSLQGRLDTDRDGLPDQCDTFCVLEGLEEDLDDDNDGILDVDDKRPKASSAIFIDTDLDGLPDYCGQHCSDLGLIGDEDDDEDGVEDAFDAFPLDPMYFADTDADGVADELDDDIDGDGVANDQDLFPFDHNESSDTDGDGVGDNSDLFPQDASESADLDGDGIGDAADDDIDGDGVGNLEDAFPFDASESIDSDNDGMGNNTDIDDDNDGIIDVLDSAPLEATLGNSQLLWVETYSRVGVNSNENMGSSVAISSDGGTLAYSSADIDATGQQGIKIRKQSPSSDSIEESFALTPPEAPRITSIDLSADGNSLVVSDSGASVGSTQTGAVSVFDYKSGIWEQRGSATSRAVVYDFLRRVTINSDGQIVGVGSLTNRSLEGGFAGILRFNGVSWETVGDYIFGNESGSQLSTGLAMNALGTIVAAGAPTGDGYSGTPIDGGRVEVYQYQQGNWVQLGQTLYGSVNNQKFGASVSLNEDGDVLAVGSSQGDKVNIYRLEQDVWVDFGEILSACENSVDGAWRGVELDQSGFIISVARHCYNAYTHDETYYYDGSAWRPLSAPLDVRANELHSAVETSLSGDGLRRLVGIPLSDSEGLTDNGAVKLYSLKLDSDGDGIVDEYDSYPLNAFAFADSDQDGVPDSIGETISMNVATGRALSKAQYEGYIRIDFSGYGDSNTGDNLYDDAFYYFNPDGTPYRYERAIMQLSDADEVLCFNANSPASQQSIMDFTVFVDGVGVPSGAFQMPYSQSHTYSIVVDIGTSRRRIALGHGDCGFWDNEGVISARITPVEAVQSFEGEVFIDAVFEERGGPFDAFPLDASETLDTDLDGIGNNADTDDDGDGVLDQSDAFPTNPLYSSDVDLDGIADEIDNCVPVANADQLDTDGDGIGDSCADLIGLQALYQSTNGDGWTSDTAWLVDGNYCTWLGVQCDSFGRVIDIDLIGNNLAGSIPAEIGALSELKVLKLAQNNLTGEIPTSIGSLLKLQELYLGSNRISGFLPRELGALSNLKILEVPYNRLSGPIPAEIGQLVSLEILSLTDNGFTGGIPDEIGNLTSLARLYINGTDVGGKIPSSVGNMVSLNILQLTSSNLTGEIPQEIMSLPNLGVLHLNDNDLSGVISEELGSYLAARSLILYGNAFICPYPTALADLFESYGELCVVDSDGDTIPDANDNCPNESNISQLDSDSDGSGNDCDADDDNDGIDDYADAFPLDPAEAADTDNDSIGNNADPDDDGDGVEDVFDALPLDATESIDIDGDGVGDNADLDDDNDSLLDLDELKTGRNPLVSDYLIAAGGINLDVGGLNCLQDDEGVKCWGNSNFSLDGLNDLFPLLDLDIRQDQMCALSSVGSLRCWGRGGAPGYDVGTGPYSKMAVGERHVCAIQNGNVECFGDNQWGQSSPPAELQGVREISAGLRFTCAIHSKGLSCWGDAGENVLDVPVVENPRLLTSSPYHSCVADYSEVKCWGTNDYGQGTSQSNLRVTSLSAGRYKTCGVSEGGVVCWGSYPLAQSPVGNNVVKLDMGLSGLYLTQEGFNWWFDDRDSNFSIPEFTIGDRDLDGVSDVDDQFPNDPDEAFDSDMDSIGDNRDLYPLVPLGDLSDADSDGAPDECDQACLDSGMLADTDDDNDGLTDEEEIALGLDPLLKDSDQDGILDAEDQTSVVVDSVFPQLTMSVITPDVAPLWSDSRLLSPSGCMIEPVALEFGENTSYYIHNFHPKTPSGIYKVGSDTPRVGHAGGVLYDQSVYVFEITNDSGVASSPQIESYNITPRPDSQEIQIEITLTNVVGGIPRYYPLGNDTRLAATVRLVFSDDTSQYFGFEFYPDDIEVISETSYKARRTVLVPVQWDVQAARVNSFHTCDAALNFFSTTSQNDTDLDGAADFFDAFPDDPLEFLDTDADGLGNNADTDDDGDGYADEMDLFPYDPLEWEDFDGDGVGNNADLDDDGDGVNDIDDAFPLDANEVADSDGDGIGDVADIDTYISLVADENLKSCIAESSVDRMTELTTLECYEAGIFSIEGLEPFSSLTMVGLGSNQIADFSPLASLSNLKVAYIRYNPINDIDFVRSLSWLEDLDITGFVGEKTGLVDKFGLKRLVATVGDFQSDAAVIATLSGMEDLSLASQNVLDVRFLNNLEILRVLRLFSASQIDWSTLPILSNLTLFEAGSANIHDLSPFASMSQLNTLFLGSNNISDISPLKNLENIRLLDLSNNIIQKLEDAPILVSKSSSLINLLNNPLDCTQLATYRKANPDIDIIFDDATCVPDRDLDGALDDDDAFPDDAAAAVDTDGDGMPDNWNASATGEQISASQLTLDADDDNDGYSDAYELETGTDPLDATDFKPPYDDLNGVVYHWSQHSVMADVGVDRSGISALTGSDGNYLFNETPEGRYDLSASLAISEYDTNRTITSADALAALKIAVGLNPNSDPDGDGPLEALAASPYQLIAADMNQDGRVTSADALAILKVAVGLGDALEPSWKLVEDSQALWSTHSDKSNVFDASQAYALTYPNQTQVDFSAILLGDVNASWRPQEGTASLDHGHFSSHAKTTGAPLSLWGIRDSDEDGLSDEQEDALGTSPIDADSDDDGINDNDDAYPLDPDKFEDVPAGVQPEPILSASPKKVDVSAITLVNPVLLRGDMNDWGEGDVFTRLEDGSYSLTKKLSPGTYTFKIATSEWVIMDLGAKDEESRLIVLDRAVQLAADSNASFVLEVDAERELVFLVESDSAGIAVLRVSELQ